MEQVFSPGGATRSLDKILNTPAIEVDLSEALPYNRPSNVWQAQKDFGAPISVLAVREITPLEAEAARRVTRTGDGPQPAMKNVRLRHHELARLLAAGLTDAEAAKIVDMHPTTIGTLKRSPAFKNLLIHYAALRDGEALGIAARLKETGLDALLELASRLRDSPEDIPTAEIRKIATDLLDRAGFSPVQKNVNINSGLSKDDIAELRKQHAPATKVIDGTATHVPGEAPSAKPSERADSFETAIFSALEGLKGTRPGV